MIQKIKMIKTETQKCPGLDKVSTCHFLQIKNTKGVFRVRQKQPPNGIGEGKDAGKAGPARLVSRADGRDQLHTLLRVCLRRGQSRILAELRPKSLLPSGGSWHDAVKAERARGKH